jgi:hypothetical protein
MELTYGLANLDELSITQIAEGLAGERSPTEIVGAIIEQRSSVVTYADRFDSYSGEQLQVTGEQPYDRELCRRSDARRRDRTADVPFGEKAEHRVREARGAQGKQSRS